MGPSKTFTFPLPLFSFPPSKLYRLIVYNQQQQRQWCDEVEKIRFRFWKYGKKIRKKCSLMVWRCVIAWKIFIVSEWNSYYKILYKRIVEWIREREQARKSAEKWKLKAKMINTYASVLCAMGSKKALLH